MSENEICEICRNERLVSKLSEELTGTTNDSYVHGLTRKANSNEISNEQYFGELITKFGEGKVAQAVLTVMQEDENAVGAPAPITDRQSQSQLQSQSQSQPSAPPEKLTEGVKDSGRIRTDQGASEVKGICGACVGRPLLGMMLTLEEWFVGKDKDTISKITQSLERGTTAEDAVSELYCAFGQSAVDGINRIIRDLNVVLEEGKDKAIKRKPELANARWD